MQKTCLISKIRLISKFMTSQAELQTIAKLILLIISRSKGNQTMKLGQLIELNMKHIFLEKSYTKCGEETNPFLTNQSLAYFWTNSLKFYRVCFYCMLNWQLVSLSHFVHDFWRKPFILLYSINWPNFIVWLLLLREILWNMCIVIVC